MSRHDDTDDHGGEEGEGEGEVDAGPEGDELVDVEREDRHLVRDRVLDKHLRGCAVELVDQQRPAGDAAHGEVGRVRLQHVQQHLPHLHEPRAEDFAARGRDEGRTEARLQGRRHSRAQGLEDAEGEGVEDVGGEGEVHELRNPHKRRDLRVQRPRAGEDELEDLGVGPRGSRGMEVLVQQILRPRRHRHRHRHQLRGSGAPVRADAVLGGGGEGGDGDLP
mmetsp:Transcript_1394/g.3056  ORF Transcript_1394/g.3056 Transcript_1394/m.3056 type:complete len:221 (+) Transcript_1394:1258-1920(+)|eukprot:758066-Hanusia_phi.AAC.8